MYIMYNILCDPTLPDSIIERLFGEPFSTKVTRSFLRALRSTYTVDGSGLEAPCNKTHYKKQPLEDNIFNAK